MKKYSLKEAMTVDGNTAGGYGTMKQRMIPRSSASGFPYDIEKSDEEEQDFITDLDDMDKFLAKTHNPTFQTDPDNVNWGYDKKSYFDGETRGVSDSLIRQYVSLVLEDIITLTPRSSKPYWVVNQFHDRVIDGTTSGWSHAFPFEDEESEERIFCFDDAVKDFEEKEGIKPNNFEK